MESGLRDNDAISMTGGMLDDDKADNNEADDNEDEDDKEDDDDEAKDDDDDDEEDVETFVSSKYESLHMSWQLFDELQQCFNSDIFIHYHTIEYTLIYRLCKRTIPGLTRKNILNVVTN